ncbi:HK97 family phage major capsid protein [Sinorhizobium terangae]|uniref:Phage major capsid protein n=1 Tax=Sinorhizobium terangae TaxID=110322 RepID=A0A6N7LTU0_SINTE|nr:phage major capsid protein [Sinorhizobium terangae]MBB4185831.1 HK97 family phage major capsid protein [Sinorhizobium terangae]MQX19374.1 phage major capsid protein [Sinorhizobium terangae]
MFAQLKELREKQARIATNARAKFDEIKDDTPAERAQEIEREFDAMMAEYDQLGGRIERMQKLDEAEARANKGDPRRPKGDDGESRNDGDGAPQYKDVFAKAIRFGVSELTPEERAVIQQHRADIPAEVRAQSTGTDSAGGYLVPEGFSGEIDKAMKAWGPMWDADVVREINTSSGNRLPWPTVDDTSQTGELKAQNGAVTDDGTGDVVFGEKQLDAYVYSTKMVRIPMELLQDSAFDMEALLNDLFGERLGRLANSVLTTGDGTNKPNGIVNASSLGKAAAAAAAITSDELIDLVHSVDPAYRASPKCRWQFNDNTMATVRKLKDGQGNYLWQMGDVRTGEPDRLLAHPYSVNQAMANIAASAKPIIFGDHSRYVVRKVRGFTVLTLRERYAENFQIGMVGFKRFDGELLNSAAVKHLQLAAA